MSDLERPHIPLPRGREGEINMQDAREHIDVLDARIGELVAARMATVHALTSAARAVNLPAYSSARQLETTRAIKARLQGMVGDLGGESFAADLAAILVRAENNVQATSGDTAPQPTDMDEALLVIETATVHLADIDTEIASRVAERLAVAEEIGRFKASNGMPVYVGGRETDVIDRFVDNCVTCGVPETVALRLITHIIEGSRSVQKMLVHA